MYSPARNRSREAVVAVARVSVRYLILLATLHVYYPLRAPRLSARSPLPATTGERSRTEPARNRHGQPRNEERMKERKEGRGEHLFDIWLLFRERKALRAKRIFPIPIPVFSNLFLTTKGRKKGWQHSRPSYLEQKEKRWLDIAAPTFQLRRETRRASRQFPRESRKFAENAVAPDLIA